MGGVQRVAPFRAHPSREQLTLALGETVLVGGGVIMVLGAAATIVSRVVRRARCLHVTRSLRVIPLMERRRVERPGCRRGLHPDAGAG